MENLEYTFYATVGPRRRGRVGVVASGDLEILAFPRDVPEATVRVQTSVDGFAPVWNNVLGRFFTANPLAVDLVIRDCGATPGMVALRLAQLKEVIS
ncbi:hypothetical protein AAW14_20140 [Streptomyces hygroscopicus]|uniref:malonate decarboxylase acyl carrier protein n=1 Tax=Streptomyces hygroscopicus TaxID=1912 RepID=UPI0022404626|nr:malonate decarboxylase acyl carrier protein [Streptomyces hygroscopicus]MCW7944285.1 hypothetical protein [Streptomyces hygroscopicus]